MLENVDFGLNDLIGEDSIKSHFNNIVKSLSESVDDGFKFIECMCS